MTNIPYLRSILGALIVVAMSLPAAAQSVVGKGKSGPAPDPVNLDITGLFQAKFASVGSDHRRPADREGAARPQGQGRHDGDQPADAGRDEADRFR
jgi:hypothetical protein